MVIIPIGAVDMDMDVVEVVVTAGVEAHIGAMGVKVTCESLSDKQWRQKIGHGKIHSFTYNGEN